MICLNTQLHHRNRNLSLLYGPIIWYMERYSSWTAHLTANWLWVLVHRIAVSSSSQRESSKMILSPFLQGQTGTWDIPIFGIRYSSRLFPSLLMILHTLLLAILLLPAIPPTILLISHLTLALPLHMTSNYTRFYA